METGSQCINDPYYCQEKLELLSLEETQYFPPLSSLETCVRWFIKQKWKINLSDDFSHSVWGMILLAVGVIIAFYTVQEVKLLSGLVLQHHVCLSSSQAFPFNCKNLDIKNSTQKINLEYFKEDEKENPGWGANHRAYFYGTQHGLILQIIFLTQPMSWGS